jgi:hypothetical protein
MIKTLISLASFVLIDPGKVVVHQMEVVQSWVFRCETQHLQSIAPLWPRFWGNTAE